MRLVGPDDVGGRISHPTASGQPIARRLVDGPLVAVLHGVGGQSVASARAGGGRYAVAVASLVAGSWLTIHLRDRNIELEPGEIFVVPRGVEHCPDAEEESAVLLIEPRDTGNAGGPMTAEPRLL